MKFYFFLAISVIPAASALGTVTLGLDIGGLQNSSGVATNGMKYGIVVDTGNSGFNAGSYLSFDITTNGQFLSTISGISDDWFVFGGSLGTGKIPPTTAGVFGLGDGAIGQEDSIDFTNLSAGDEFAVIWFPGATAASSGDDYGFFTDIGSTLNMVVPSDGTTDSTPPEEISTRSVDFQVVPEPSYAVFGLLCFIALFARRRFTNIK